jgi:hypothetical protein
LVKLGKLGVELVAYADDIAIVVRENNKKRFEKLVKEIFKLLREWSIASGVELNEDKTIGMCVGKKKYSQVVESICEIKLRHQIKYLGLVISDDLKWNGHLEHLEEKKC